MKELLLNQLLRGGSWYAHPRCCRSAYRDHFGPGSAGNDVGFRVVCINHSIKLKMASAPATDTDFSDFLELLIAEASVYRSSPNEQIRWIAERVQRWEREQCAIAVESCIKSCKPGGAWSEAFETWNQALTYAAEYIRLKEDADLIGSAIAAAKTIPSGGGVILRALERAKAILDQKLDSTGS